MLKRMSGCIFYIALIIINAKYKMFDIEHAVTVLFVMLCPFMMDRYNTYHSKYETLAILHLCLIEILKFMIIPYLAVNGKLCAPVNVDDIETLQMTGLITIGVLVLFCAITVAMGMRDVKKFSSMLNCVEAFDNNPIIEESMNICIGVCVSALANVLVTAVLYNIGLGIGILVYIYAIAIIGLAYIIGVTGITRKRKEDIIEEYKNNDAKEDVKDGNSN